MIILAIASLASLVVGYILLSMNAASDLNNTFVIKLGANNKRYKLQTEHRPLTEPEKRTRLLIISWSLIVPILFLLLYILGQR